MLRFIDLFCGIGSFRTAFERAGCECVFSCDSDHFARQSYLANYGDEPTGDITKIEGKDIPDFDILCAGFPCQPFSTLGKRKGFKDKGRGNLFFEILRILKEKKPRAFILENVRGLMSVDGGETFRRIITSLERLGYKVRWKVINAKLVVPQNRERVFIVGCLGEPFEFPVIENRKPKLVDYLDEEVDAKYDLTPERWERQKRHYEKTGRWSIGVVFGELCPCILTDNRLSLPRAGKTPRRLTPREIGRLMGFSDDFKIVVSDTQAWKQFGNSIVVPLAEELARALVTHLA
jgi:DNA (cytosine-5)-methyltransferase 1